MKRIGLLALGVIFMSMMASFTHAQGAAQPGTGKIGWIDSGAFDDDKDGIKRYVAAATALELEFKPRVKELEDIQTRINAIQDELSKMGSNPAVPVKPETVAAKQEEGQRLQREGEFKQKELQAAAAKRRDAVLGPIQADIGRAMNDYAKQKGYTAILDWGKLAQAGILFAFDPGNDITKDFITYYNTRPNTATTAAPGTPPAKP